MRTYSLGYLRTSWQNLQDLAEVSSGVYCAHRAVFYSFALPHQIPPANETCCTAGRNAALSHLPSLLGSWSGPHRPYGACDTLCTCSGLLCNHQQNMQHSGYHCSGLEVSLMDQMRTPSLSTPWAGLSTYLMIQNLPNPQASNQLSIPGRWPAVQGHC